jgi:hypothetical protein
MLPNFQLSQQYNIIGPTYYQNATQFSFSIMVHLNLYNIVQFPYLSVQHCQIHSIGDTYGAHITPTHFDM